MYNFRGNYSRFSISHRGTVDGEQSGRLSTSTARENPNPMKGRGKMFYNYDMLAARIAEVCGTVREFARRIGRTEKTVKRHLLNGSSFKLADIDKAADVLGISHADIEDYFFRLA